LTNGVGVTALDDAEYPAATTPIDVAVSVEPPLTTSPLLLLDRIKTPQFAVTGEPPLTTNAFEADWLREYMQAGPLIAPLTAREETLTVL